MRIREFAIALIMAASLAASVRSQTPKCDALTPPKRELAQRVLQSEHPYDCCDDTITRCLTANPRCALAVRLAENICQRVAAGQDEARIRRSLSRRARSMVGGDPPAVIDLAAAPSIGPADAPVTVVVYACARCPFCHKLVPALVQETRTGRLQGRARLVFRTFPIRGHEGSTEGGLAFTAAAELGRFWEFMLHSYQHFDEFSPEVQRDWAVAVGLDGDVFAARTADQATREKLIASKKEGVVNNVQETPTVFINSRRWVGDLDLDELVDAIEEECQHVGGEVWQKN